ncbi:hypothetical protein N7532_002633 [Penicillium argentinense]|uniref:O-methylsterigmatocystin oxidoreductase n=1 Tax=Penicillium argentinense TaxID=1131581 RepID=A0A9W9G0S2_9EURO|nr:uncharacterized protein N7532_002633 [Penicillium argentinense]KAJ5109988.1 hypothetical protein N7532_002633 [Penicillium argentinense]
MVTIQQLAVFAVFVVVVLAFRSVSAGRKAGKLPPGPKGKPIIGNLFDLPPTGQQEWTHWLKHKEQYGPLSSISVLGKTIVIINDRKLAQLILEKNSAKHSSRPRLVFADELTGWGKAPSSQDNTSLLRSYRRAMARIIGTRASMSKFDDLLETEARRFIWRVLHTPERFVDHIRTEAGAFILKITYGYNIEPHGEDPLVNLADLALQQFSNAIVPGAWLVDMIPALKHIPEWTPGAKFQKTARYYLETLTQLVENPVAFTKYQMSEKKENKSFTSALLSQGEDEEIVKWSAVALYGGGADTTVAALEGFFLAMVLFPEVQRKAQEEIDSVFGKPSFPSVADREKLPYINAIVKEALRWHTVGPLGVPHRTDEDDIVGDYLIPKDAMLLPNIWSFNNDPKVYPEPRVFRPERYIASKEGDSVELDPAEVSFGFGRRICPGRLVADGSLYLTIAHTLAVFDIRKPIGNDGKEVESPVDFTPGIISHPVPYTCRITPRSKEHRQLIIDFEKNQPFENSDADELIRALRKH